MIEVILLGTAALAPLPDRALAAAALVCAGRAILFDCGEGTQTQARARGLSLMKLDIVALSHYHGDHIFGLPGLLQTLNCMGRTEPLYLIGPQGLEQAMAPVLTLAGPTAYEVRLAALPEGGLRLCSLLPAWPWEARLSAFPTRHRVPSQGYCFTLGRAGRFLPERARALGVPTAQWGLLQKGQSVKAGEAAVLPEQVLGPPRRGLKLVFSGDTAACDSLVRAAEDADLLICDATYGENAQAEQAREYGHMNFAQAAETAARAGARRLWLSHYSQMVGRPEDCLPNAAALFPNTVCGADGMSLTLRFQD